MADLLERLTRHCFRPFKKHFPVGQLGFIVIVLSDPAQRSIYDKFGARGLESVSNMAVGFPLYQTEEIKRFLEREERARKELLDEQGVVSRSVFAFGIDASDTLGIEKERSTDSRAIQFHSSVLSHSFQVE